MANAAKAKGTKAETRVVNYLLAAGLEARRLVMKGSADEGDVYFVARSEVGEFGVILEVKCGKQTQNISRKQREDWLAETRTEGENAERDSYLVIAKHGSSVKDYHVWSNKGDRFWYLDDFTERMGGQLE